MQQDLERNNEVDIDKAGVATSITPVRIPSKKDEEFTSEQTQFKTQTFSDKKKTSPKRSSLIKKSWKQLEVKGEIINNTSITNNIPSFNIPNTKDINDDS